MKKVIFAVAVASFPFAGTYLYFWIWNDYYFPDRYEVAYLALGVAAIVSTVALVSVSAFFLVSHFRRQ